MIYLPLINKFAYLCHTSEDRLHLNITFSCKHESYVFGLHYLCFPFLKREVHLIFNFHFLILKVAEQRRTSRTPKGKAPQPVTDYGRIQPQAPELEEAVLGALMIEKDAYSLVSEILRPESFYEHRHQLIYSAITDLAVNQKPVDILTVKEQLSKRGELEEVGGPFYITQLSSKVASSAHIEYHARIIAQKALARELITFTSNIQSKAFDETLDVDDLMQEAEGKLFEISQQNMKKDYTQINPVIAEAYDLIQKAAARTDGLSGLVRPHHYCGPSCHG